MNRSLSPGAARLIRVGAAVCAALAVLAFFLPWIRLSPPPPKYGIKERRHAEGVDKKTGRIKHIGGTVDEVLSGLLQGTREASSKLTGIPPKLSGFRIPLVANSRLAKNVMDLVKSFTKKKEDVGRKSWAVYALPVLACLIGLLLAAFPRSVPLAVLVVAAGAGVFGAGVWQLLTANLTSEFVRVDIEYGLWLSLLAYLGLAKAGCFVLLPGAVQERLVVLLAGPANRTNESAAVRSRQEPV